MLSCLHSMPEACRTCLVLLRLLACSSQPAVLVQAKGLAAGQGTYLSADTEEADADELRAAVSDALCRNQARLKHFQEVVPSIEALEGGMRKCAPCGWSGAQLTLLRAPTVLTLLPVFFCCERPSKL